MNNGRAALNWNPYHTTAHSWCGSFTECHGIGPVHCVIIAWHLLKAACANSRRIDQEKTPAYTNDNSDLRVAACLPFGKTCCFAKNGRAAVNWNPY
jgi:hypothetical protein